jgi:hypothetical protein
MKKVQSKRKEPQAATPLKKYYGLLIALAGVLIYLPTLWFFFSPLDEQVTFLAKKEIYGKIVHLGDLFVSPLLGMYYRPVMTSSFMFDMITGRGSPFPFHLTNVLLHGACIFFIYRLFLQLHLGEKQASVFSLLFALHPLVVSNASWIPGRNDSLLCLFSVLAILKLIDFADAKKKTSLFWHFIFFTLALLTKESAVVLPALFAAVLFFGRNVKVNRSLILVCSSWLFIGAAWFAIRLHIVHFLPAAPDSSHFLNTFQTFISAFIIYTGKCLFPVQQSVLPLVKFTSIWPGIVTIVFVAVLFIRFGTQNKKIAWLGASWFFLFIIIPTWVSASSAAEQYESRAYTPLVGFLLLVSQVNIPLTAKSARTLVISILIIFSVKSIYRSRVYHDPYSFADAGTEESPSFAHFYYWKGQTWESVGDYEEAIVYYSKAIEVRPDKSTFYTYRGRAFMHVKNYPKAVEDFNKALDLGKESLPIKYRDRAFAYFFLQDYQKSRSDALNAMKLNAASIPTRFIDSLNVALKRNSLEIIDPRSLPSGQPATGKTEDEINQVEK